MRNLWRPYVSPELTELTTVLTAAFARITALITAAAAVDDTLVVCSEQIVDDVHGSVVPVASVPASVPAPVAPVAAPQAAEETLVLLSVGFHSTATVMAAGVAVVAIARHLLSDIGAVGNLHIDIWSGQGRSHKGREDEGVTHIEG